LCLQALKEHKNKRFRSFLLPNLFILALLLTLLPDSRIVGVIPAWLHNCEAVSNFEKPSVITIKNKAVFWLITTRGYKDLPRQLHLLSLNCSRFYIAPLLALFGRCNDVVANYSYNSSYPVHALVYPELIRRVGSDFCSLVYLTLRLPPSQA
jgi:hypothetical protein